MFSKSIITVLFGLSVAFIPSTRATADTGDFVAGAVIGGLVGHVATKNAQQRKQATSSSSSRTYSTIPSTQEGREIQTSLNYYGFDAGYVDGQLGRRSRNAISSYQAYLGFPSTGYLSPYEQQLLVGSYYRAQAGGPWVSEQMANYQQGTRSLLVAYRDELAGQPAPGAATTTVVTAPAPAAPAPATTLAATPTLQSPQGTTETAALPNFLGNGSSQSLASHCNTVSLLTNTNGGFTTQATMTDPNVALNEQFCLMRTYAIATSEDMIANLQGFTPDQIVDQCEQFGPVMQPYVAALALKSQQEVTNEVATVILDSGMSPSQIKGTAKICLGVGYRIDDLDVALGSALILFAMGDQVYGEVMGHHLSQGFGTSRRVDLAQVWYAAALKAVDAGAPAVFAPGQPERVELLRNASMSLSGSSSGLVPGQATVQPASALPNLGAASE